MPIAVRTTDSERSLQLDTASRQMVMDGRAKDTRGDGTASAKIRARLEEESPVRRPPRPAAAGTALDLGAVLRPGVARKAGIAAAVLPGLLLVLRRCLR